MQKVSNNLYSQEFYSHDFFLLDGVLWAEKDRLWHMGIVVEDWRYSLNRIEGDIYFYLTLYFSSTKGEPLDYETVYGGID